MIKASGIDAAWEKLNTNAGGGLRFVIDIEKSKLYDSFMPKE